MSIQAQLFQRPIRIGTRKSELAVWQAEWIGQSLKKRWGERIEIEYVKVTTRGDEIIDRPLHEVGGKGLFVGGLESLLLSEDIDLAVHSLKDMPAELAKGLHLVCTPPREDPRDVLVGRGGELRATKLPPGARVGTSSLRRAALIRRLNASVEVVPIRGNVPTRLAKVDAGEVDCAVLAMAGLKRLGLAGRIAESFEPERFCPAACQGILAVECRKEDIRLRDLLKPLHDVPTWHAATAERAFLRRLEGGCQVPVGCYAELRAEDVLTVSGVIAHPSGRPCFMATKVGPPDRAEKLGRELAETLLRLGANRILDSLREPAQMAC